MATSTVNPLEEAYTDPHILRCLHTFCYQCIQDSKQGNRVQCPECRQHTNLSEAKKDFNMESLCEIYKNTSQKNNKPHETLCDLCEDSTKPVQFFCTNCEECLCASCSKANRKRKVSKTHKFITFIDL